MPSQHRAQGHRPSIRARRVPASNMAKSGRYAPGARKGKPDHRLRVGAANKLRAVNTALRHQVQQHRAEIAALMEGNSSLCAKVKQQAAEIAKLMGDNSSLRTQVKQQAAEIAKLMGDKSSLRNEVQQQGDRVQHLETLYRLTADELKKEVNARLASGAAEMPRHIAKVWNSLR